MELSEEDEDASPTKGIEHDHLSNALDSFYASLGPVSAAATPSNTPPQSNSPTPAAPVSSSSTTVAAPATVAASFIVPPAEDSLGSNSPVQGEDDRDRRRKKVRCIKEY
jgi:hypothetical protein